MKVKFKLTAEQFRNLVYWVHMNRPIYSEVTELQLINLQIFEKIAFKKMIDTNAEDTLKPAKLRLYSIEVNQYTAIMALLEYATKYLDPFTLAIFITLQNQNRNLLNLI